MKTLKMIVSREGVKLPPEDEVRSDQGLVAEVIKNIILNYGAQHQGGLTEEDRRLYYKLADIFEKADKEKLESVELEDNYFGLIKKCKRETMLMPNLLIRRVEELIEEVKDR